MSVIELPETPIKTPTKIVIEPNELQRKLMLIREMVVGNQWCRDKVHDYGTNRSCMLGLILRV